MRIRLLGIDLQVFDRLLDDLLGKLPLLGQGVERRDDGAFGVDFEEAAEVLARVAAAEPVRAERG